jgi:3-deoxy-D-manno-octulosonic-acid transferase
MRYLLDACYAIGLLMLAPWLLWRAWRAGKYRNLPSRLVGAVPEVPAQAVWFHGVSLGEINMLAQLVRAFRQRHPALNVVVSSTTETGLEAARKHLPDVTVFAFPFDFSWAVSRALGGVKPSLVVLGESEMWPNFVAECGRREVPVVVVNGRMSPRSLWWYSLVRPLVNWLFASLARVGAQTGEHAAAFLSLGGAPGSVRVTGNIKYDGAMTDRNNSKTEALGRLLSVQPGDRMFVAGSTQPGEEAAALEAFRKLRHTVPGLRLVVVPRAPERFDEVARLIEASGVAFVRRSTMSAGERADVVLVDTIGELGALWGLAEAAFVGGSLDGRRGGQSMIEPAAFGAAVLFGPYVWNFKDTAEQLLRLGGAYQVTNAKELTETVGRLLGDEKERRSAGAAARAFVREQEGAVERTLVLLDEVLPRLEAKAA